MSFAPAAGSAAPTAIHTNVAGLAQGNFQLLTKGAAISAYYAAPAGKTNLPVVLVVQEIFGIHEHIKDICRRLGKAGYLAVAANLYERQGDASAYTDIPKLISEVVSKVSDEQVYADLDACVAWAAKNGGDPKRVGITGFCWGGRLVWMYAAHNPAVKAAVAWYGKLTTGHGPLIKTMAVDIADKLYAPVLGLYAEKDTGISLDSVALMKKRLAAGNENSKASEIIVYPGAQHGFLADYRPMYDRRAAEDGWKRLLAWFGKYL
jgi:carboxymethylenebutenolidase